MKRLARRLGIAVCRAALGLFLGWHIAQAIASYGTVPMPAIVDRALVAFVTGIGHPELNNPDDMFVLAGTLYWLLSSAAVWIVLGAAWRSVHGRKAA